MTDYIGSWPKVVTDLEERLRMAEQALRPLRLFVEAFEDSGGIERLTDGEWLNLRAQLMVCLREVAA